MSETALAQPYMPVKAKLEDQNTPERILAPVRRIFGGEIDFDPCGNPTSIVGAKRQIWLQKWAEGRTWSGGVVLPPDVTVGDGLEVPWAGSTFVNPPYSARILTAFMRRAREAARRGVPTIMLTKVKLIKGWHENVRAAPAVCFIDGRLVFGGAGGECAPFDCALVLWTESRELVNRFALELDGKLGDVMFHR